MCCLDLFTYHFTTAFFVPRYSPGIVLRRAACCGSRVSLLAIVCAPPRESAHHARVRVSKLAMHFRRRVFVLARLPPMTLAVSFCVVQLCTQDYSYNYFTIGRKTLPSFLNRGSRTMSISLNALWLNVLFWMLYFGVTVVCSLARAGCRFLDSDLCALLCVPTTAVWLDNTFYPVGGAYPFGGQLRSFLFFIWPLLLRSCRTFPSAVSHGSCLVGHESVSFVCSCCPCAACWFLSAVPQHLSPRLVNFCWSWSFCAAPPDLSLIQGMSGCGDFCGTYQQVGLSFSSCPALHPALLRLCSDFPLSFVPWFALCLCGFLSWLSLRFSVLAVRPGRLGAL